jgi:hypothetical protein
VEEAVVVVVADISRGASWFVDHQEAMAES